MQDKRVYDYLKKNETIDPLQSWVELGVYRLAASIHRLRKLGWNITTERKGVLNQFGEKCNVARYRLL